MIHREEGRKGGSRNSQLRLLSKQYMPDIFHHPPADLIQQLSVEKPLSDALILSLWTLPNLLASDRKLRAARGSNLLWYWYFLSKHVLPSLDKDMLARSPFVGCAERLNLGWAAWDPDAAEVDVALTFEEVNLQLSQRVDIAVLVCVCVPGLWVAVLVRVDKSDDFREIVVVVDKVCEI